MIQKHNNTPGPKPINFKEPALKFLDALENIAKSSVAVADNSLPLGAPENAITDRDALKHARDVIRRTFKSFNPKSEHDYEKLWELISSAYIIGSCGVISATVRQAIAREPKPPRFSTRDIAKAIKEVSASKGIPIKAGLKYVTLHFQKDVAMKLGVDPINPRNLSARTLKNTASKIKSGQI